MFTKGSEPTFLRRGLKTRDGRILRSDSIPNEPEDGRAQRRSDPAEGPRREPHGSVGAANLSRKGYFRQSCTNFGAAGFDGDENSVMLD